MKLLLLAIFALVAAVGLGHLLQQDPGFIIIESNSACSMGEVTQVKYKEALTSLIKSL